MIILDYRTNNIALRDECGDLIDPDVELRAKITKEYLIERKAIIIERLMMYADELLSQMNMVSEGIALCSQSIHSAL